MTKIIFLFAITALALSACTSSPRKMEALDSGYDKITIARNDTPTENEQIKPEFITEIKKSNEVVTVLETYTPKRGQQQNLVQALLAEFRKMSGKVPGLVSFNLHRANTKTGHVYNYMQFESRGALAAWQASEPYKSHLAAISPFITSAEPEPLEVVYIQQ
jgi:quinol monooxygenase YgiN